MAIPVGSKAPDFTLNPSRLRGFTDVKLSNNFGKKNTVLLFFPLAFTGVCTQEMLRHHRRPQRLHGRQREVLGISVDSPFAQEAWAQKEKIGVTLCSDLNKKTADAYGTLLPDLNGLGSVSARAAFVVDKSGVIQYSEQSPSAQGTSEFQGDKRPHLPS